LHITSVEEDQPAKKRHAKHAETKPQKKNQIMLSQFIVNKKKKKEEKSKGAYWLR